VREVAVRRIDDGVDRLFQEVASNHLEAALFGYDFLRRLRGTFAPARRAWDRPIAIACLRLLTFFPDLPLRSVPRLRSRIA
jgi:hypothetical protein